jgi:hypothetical protein
VGKLFIFIHIRQMALPMYLGHYEHESVNGEYPATSNYDHTHAKHAIASFSKSTIVTEHVKRIPSVLL